MSFSVSGQGGRVEVLRHIRRGVPDSVITRAVAALLELFPADALMVANASGHLGQDSGNVSISLSRERAPVVVQPPAEVAGVTTTATFKGVPVAKAVVEGQDA